MVNLDIHACSKHLEQSAWVAWSRVDAGIICIRNGDRAMYKNNYLIQGFFVPDSFIRSLISVQRVFKIGSVSIGLVQWCSGFFLSTVFPPTRSEGSFMCTTTLELSPSLHRNVSLGSKSFDCPVKKVSRLLIEQLARQWRVAGSGGRRGAASRMRYAMRGRNCGETRQTRLSLEQLPKLLAESIFSYFGPRVGDN